MTDPSGLWDVITEPIVPHAHLALHGDSGDGKTTFATSLPWGSSRWGDKALYVAWDRGSEALESVSPADAAHLIPIVPRRKGAYDPFKLASELSSKNWSEVYPEAKTIIWDTMSYTAQEILGALANTGAFASRDPKRVASGTADPHIVVGEKGKPGYMALPIEGDYGLAQNAILQILGFLLNQPMNVICLFQSDIYIPKSDGGQVIGEAQGGPGTAGGKGINKVSQLFNTVVRLDVRAGRTVPGEGGRPVVQAPRFLAYTEPRGIWQSKLRKPKELENSLAEIEVTGDPREKFWIPFDKLTLQAWKHAEGAK